MIARRLYLFCILLLFAAACAKLIPSVWTRRWSHRLSRRIGADAVPTAASPERRFQDEDVAHSAGVKYD